MRVMKRQLVATRIIALIVATVALSGCSLNTDLSGPTSIIILNGQGQTAATSTALPTPLTVVVVGSFLEAIPDQPVTWSIVAPGGGSLSTLTSVTDEHGTASTSYTTGSTAGAVKIQANSNALPAVFFDVTVTP